MKKKSLNPVIIILIVLLFGVKLFVIFSCCMRFVQPGGAADIGTLKWEYQKAVNDGDVDRYLALVPRSERNSLEKSCVSDKLKNLSGHNYQMELEDEEKKDSDRTGEIIGELLVLDPIGSPIVSKVYDAHIKVKDESGESNIITLEVLEINDRYFIHDVEMD